MPQKPVLIVTRPKADADKLKALLAPRGLSVVTAPLLTIGDVKEARPAYVRYQAILVTSANGIEALARLGHAKNLSQTAVICVGPASAEAARAAGFSDISIATPGDVSGLIEAAKLDLDPAGPPLLYPSGRETTGDIKGELTAAGFRVDRQIVYEARAAARLPKPAVMALTADGEASVVLYSPRTAKIWFTCVANAGLEDRVREIDHFCLSNAVAKQVRWRLGQTARILTASQPDNEAMIELLGQQH